MTERMEAWQCIGCGRLDSDAKCLGICQDRKVVVVSAADYDELRLFIKQLASVEPHGESWERTYRALQERARQVLAD